MDGDKDGVGIEMILGIDIGLRMGLGLELWVGLEVVRFDVEDGEIRP